MKNDSHSSDIESLIGTRYDDLANTAQFARDNVPERELIGDRSYVSFQQLGISLVLPNNENVGAVHLYSGGYDGFREYLGVIPGDVTFQSSRQDIRAAFGDPDVCGEAKHVEPLGIVPPWDRFTSKDLWLHFTYSSDCRSIQLITIMDPKIMA
jgi:hypothetical protein